MKTNPNDSINSSSEPQRFQNTDTITLYEAVGGLTKREYFAGLAIPMATKFHGDYPKKVARTAVSMADALIAALNKDSGDES